MLTANIGDTTKKLMNADGFSHCSTTISETECRRSLDRLFHNWLSLGLK